MTSFLYLLSKFLACLQHSDTTVFLGTMCEEIYLYFNAYLSNLHHNVPCVSFKVCHVLTDYHAFHCRVPLMC